MASWGSDQMATADGTTAVFHRLLVGAVAGLLGCAALVAISYFFVDRPVAWRVARHPPPASLPLRWLTWPIPWMLTAAPLVLAAGVIWRAWQRWPYWLRVAMAMGLALIVSAAVKEQLKWVFGRTWPDTWIDNNPSLIRDGVFGFHPFRAGTAYESFPSGHTTTIVAAMSVLWLASRRPWAAVIAAGSTLAVVVGLIADNYHFVGDCIAGGYLGWISGAYVSACLGVNRRWMQGIQPPEGDVLAASLAAAADGSETEPLKPGSRR
jgi:membrane-associated phospholipid phosphatase